MKNCVDQKLKNLKRRIIMEENKITQLNYVNMPKANKNIVDNERRKIKTVRGIKKLNNKKTRLAKQQ